jgi:hypothetical protein
MVFGILQIKTFSFKTTFGKKAALNHFAKSGAITSNCLLFYLAEAVFW